MVLFILATMWLAFITKHKQCSQVDASYIRFFSGKWHLGFYKDEYIPINRGFDSYMGYLTGSEDYYTRER